MLGGIGPGNCLGGRLTDRYKPARTVNLLLLATSFLLARDVILGRGHAVTARDRSTIRGPF